MNCPSFESLVDFVDKRLAEPEAARVAAHLDTGCGLCDETTSWYERVRLTADADDSTEPPSWVFKRAVRIFVTQPRSPRLVQRIGDAIASLIFDSFSRPALVGIRATETANRQLLYRANDYSIDLQVTALEHSSADLTGQILKEGGEEFDSVCGLKLELARAGNVIASAVTNDIGEFKVSGIEHGVYDLQVELSEGKITVPRIPVGEVLVVCISIFSGQHPASRTTFTLENPVTLSVSFNGKRQQSSRRTIDQRRKRGSLFARTTCRSDWKTVSVLKQEVDRLIGSDLIAARNLSERVDQLAKALGDPVSKGFAEASRARVLHHNGRYAEADHLYERAIQATRRAKLTTRDGGHTECTVCLLSHKWADTMKPSGLRVYRVEYFPGTRQFT
jgi:hypothetical protein